MTPEESFIGVTDKGSGLWILLLVALLEVIRGALILTERFTPYPSSVIVSLGVPAAGAVLFLAISRSRRDRIVLALFLVDIVQRVVFHFSVATITQGESAISLLIWSTLLVLSVNWLFLNRHR